MAVLNLADKEITQTDDREKAIISIVEHIRSQELSFFEEATAIQNLIEHYGLTQEEAAAKLGRVQSTIANKLRLLRLTSDEQATIMQFSLTERHARALLRIASPEDRALILDKIIDEGLNVDKTEQLIDKFIGSENHRRKCRKRSGVFRSVTIFANTISKAVESMKSAGVSADSQEIKGDDYIEYRVRIPVSK
ncbi:MAG: ParB/RepB/Spo0J family partition protein [Ruminococcus flavefaciens]|nr:ParB/RepB/Spo0J family partition protein [Ruminococcus flavefaciens]MCM1228641.1 ParB/RepB/Spo0J family partition protein [Ruminococcus flavefaciens]